MAFSIQDFFEYLKELILNQRWGLSDSSYPQTVQYFIFEAFPCSFQKFSLIFLASFATLGLFMLFKARKREMEKDFSRLSLFLRMDLKKVKKQALFAALPGQALFWCILSPSIFLILLLMEAQFGFQGLGTLVRIALARNDMPLLYGSLLCVFSFISALSAFFLFTMKLLRR